jgi:multiple sugar transport system permease protein
MVGKASVRYKSIRVLKIVLVILILIFFLFPIYWVSITAFKHSEEWFKWPPVLIPQTLTFNNFLGTEGGFFGGIASIATIIPYLRNSLIVAIATAFLSTLIGSMAAYSISRFKTGGIAFANWIISLRMLPPVAVILPLYIFFKQFGLLNTRLAIILCHLVFTTPLSTWILITFFKEIPKEMDEAAYVDGASHLQSFFRIVLPLSAPGLAAVTTLAFIQSWGEFLIALLLTSNADAQTLPVYLGRYITGFRIAWGPLAAAGLIVMIPVIVFSLLMQRYLIRGLTFGAVKG